MPRQASEVMPGPRPSDDALWTAADVARFLRASKSWVYRAAETGDLPCQRIGGLLRFHPDAIRRFAGRTSR